MLKIIFAIICLIILLVVLLTKAFKAYWNEDSLESENLELREIIDLKNERIEMLLAAKGTKKNSDWNKIQSEVEVPVPSTYSRLPVVNLDSDFLTPTHEQSSEQMLVADEKLAEQNSKNMLLNENLEAEMEQMEVELVEEAYEELEYSVQVAYSAPKITELADADLPDSDFIKRLNGKSKTNVIRMFPESTSDSSGDPLHRETEHSIAESVATSVSTECDENGEQIEIPFELEATRRYSWSPGHHHLIFQINDHHGTDIAECEIIGRGTVTMMQHPMLVDMLNGDLFEALIRIEADGRRIVQELKILLNDEVDEELPLAN